MDGNKKYKHLDQVQRDRLQALLVGGTKQVVIARILRVSPSTISREIRRNCRKLRTDLGPRDGPYESDVAEQKAYVKRKYSKYQWKKINHDAELYEYVIDKLSHYWSPDQISGRMKKDHEPFYASKTAIYEWLYSNIGQRYCPYLYSSQYRPRRQNKDKDTKKTLILNRISLNLRPLGAKHRSRYGHWEGDTMVSGKKTGSKAALSVLYERKARYLDARKINNLRPGSNKEAILEMSNDKTVKSYTFDNGLENARHYELGWPTFFCDPYSSWQKGGVENVIKWIRRYIPKGADLNNYSDDYVNMVVAILNGKPRKSLGYRTPYEVMAENNLFKNINSENCT